MHCQYTHAGKTVRSRARTDSTFSRTRTQNPELTAEERREVPCDAAARRSARTNVYESYVRTYIHTRARTYASKGNHKSGYANTQI